jgi:RHS repeat-associated protein
VDEAGGIIANYAYDEWGVPAGAPSGLNTFGFAGEDYDPVTGLVFLRARYYKPDIGRFVTQDEVVGAQTDPLSWNLYIYARNNPTTLADPSGKFGWVAILIVAIITGALSVGTYALVTVAAGGEVSWSDVLLHFGTGFIFGLISGGVGALFFKAASTAQGISKFLIGMASGGLGAGAGGLASRFAANIFTGRPPEEGLFESFVWNAAVGALTGGMGEWLSGRLSFFKMQGRIPGFYPRQIIGYLGPNTWKFVKQQVFQDALGEIISLPRDMAESIEKAYKPTTLQLGGIL